MSYSVTSQVFLNGAPVAAKSWSVQCGADQFVGQWKIELIDPVNTQLGDKWTIERTFDPGGTRTLIQDVESDGLGAKVSSAVTATIKGKVEGPQLDPKVSAGIDLYFCSSTYLDAIAPFGWREDQGVLYYSGGGMSPGQALNPPRMFDRLLPQPNQAIGTFKCITGSLNHHRVATYLAQLMGCNIMINVPIITVQRVLHISGNDEPVSGNQPAIFVVERRDKN